MGVSSPLLKDEIAEWVKQHQCVKDWLNGLAKATADRYIITFYHWITKGLQDPKLTGKSPDELLAIQENSVGREHYRILSCAQRWVQGMTQLRHASKIHHLVCIRSFFDHNHVELPRDRTFQFHSEVARVSGKMTVEDCRKIVYKANRTYQPAFLCMLQGGMDESAIIYVNEHLSKYIVEEIQRGKKRIRLVLPGRKKRRNIVPYATMIGHDAIEAIKPLLPLYKKHGVLFTNQFDEPISKDNVFRMFHSCAVRSKVLQKKARACSQCGEEAFPVRRRRVILYECQDCGFLTPASNYKASQSEKSSTRYEFGAHEFRDLFRTRWQLSGAAVEVCEEMMGHTVDENEYLKIFDEVAYLEEQFKIAEHYLNILSEDPLKVDRVELSEQEARIKQLEANQRLMEATLLEVQRRAEELARK
jgi:predicted RNA-binding Zn-ribbon protein involved in translation (DUF1610 family)